MDSTQKSEIGVLKWNAIAGCPLELGGQSAPRHHSIERRLADNDAVENFASAQQWFYPRIPSVTQALEGYATDLLRANLPLNCLVTTDSLVDQSSVADVDHRHLYKRPARIGYFSQQHAFEGWNPIHLKQIS
jgi:hypothetical protein